MIYADTSFIASCYVDDINTEKALEYLAKIAPRLPFVFLHWPEIARAIAAKSVDSEGDWDAIKSDIDSGVKLFSANLDAERTGRRAAGLMRNFYPRWNKLRSLDVMHVAAAVESGSKVFLSFDRASHQRVLASTQRLEVWPPLTPEEKSRLKA
jgi:predicted nucleic acid-binding protein